MLIGWGGVLFTTGLEYGTQTSSFSQAISYSQSQSINFGAPFGTQTGTVAWNSNFNLGVQSTVFSLPLELSSSFNILYFLSLYMGVGMDLNTGSSTTVGGASGPITVTTSGGTLPGNVFSGDGKLVLDNTGVNGTPSFSDFRLFLGTELNLWAVKVVIQGNYMSNKTLAAFLGLRVAY